MLNFGCSPDAPAIVYTSSPVGIIVSGPIFGSRFPVSFLSPRLSSLRLMVIPLPCGFLWPLRFFKRISGEINKQKKNPFFFFSISYFHFLGGMETPWHLMTLSGYIPLGRFHPSGTKREPGESDQPEKKKKKNQNSREPWQLSLCIYIYKRRRGVVVVGCSGYTQAAASDDGKYYMCSRLLLFRTGVSDRNGRTNELPGPYTIL